MGMSVSVGGFEPTASGMGATVPPSLHPFTGLADMKHNHPPCPCCEADYLTPAGCFRVCRTCGLVITHRALVQSQRWISTLRYPGSATLKPVHFCGHV
jgi:predicted amidophosphoribosyltransferase